jgi:hypothetical protein
MIKFRVKLDLSSSTNPEGAVLEEFGWPVEEELLWLLPVEEELFWLFGELEEEFLWLLPVEEELARGQLASPTPSDGTGISHARLTDSQSWKDIVDLQTSFGLSPVGVYPPIRYKYPSISVVMDVCMRTP